MGEGMSILNVVIGDFGTCSICRLLAPIDAAHLCDSCADFVRKQEEIDDDYEDYYEDDYGI